MAAGLRVPSAAEAGRAAVTADARVTAADATVIARLAAGL
jgi:hypothetical protein